MLWIYELFCFVLCVKVFVSENKDTASRDVDNFFNFADMQMGLWVAETKIAQSMDVKFCLLWSFVFKSVLLAVLCMELQTVYFNLQQSLISCQNHYYICRWDYLLNVSK